MAGNLGSSLCWNIFCNVLQSPAPLCPYVWKWNIFYILYILTLLRAIYAKWAYYWFWCLKYTHQNIWMYYCKHSFYRPTLYNLFSWALMCNVVAPLQKNITSVVRLKAVLEHWPVNNMSLSSISSGKEFVFVLQLKTETSVKVWELGLSIVIHVCAVRVVLFFSA